MIPLRSLLNSPEIRDAMLFGDDSIPIYARVDGTLRQVDGVERSEITLADGSGRHTVLVIAVSEQIGEEA